jgi:hypothetical protein
LRLKGFFLHFFAFLFIADVFGVPTIRCGGRSCVLGFATVPGGMVDVIRLAVFFIIISIYVFNASILTTTPFEKAFAINVAAAAWLSPWVVVVFTEVGVAVKL